ncbi:hypothetical protein [Janibacter cremeus]|uniref:DUF4192 family protein n=1 Tax=Janibacter cremeus TaxID=1285192 RepID=A0A852VLT5_9MICO|nr:hypothetical protein [Janibacter cremeus]NYF97056.1 hypothetical protein [Janibacter cremeus]
MTFDNLPSDWPTRPLTDTDIAPDVVDLVVRESDRETGCLSILLCGDGDRLLQPVAITDLDGEPYLRRREVFDTFLGGLGDVLSGIVVAVGRPRGLQPDDEARAWHEAAIASCREHDVPLLGTYLATIHGVVEMPRWEQLRTAG